MNTLSAMKARFLWLAAAAVSALLLSSPLPSAGAAFPHLANPKEIPSCTKSLVSDGNLTKKAVATCLKMVGHAYVPERCSKGSTGYLIGLLGWKGIPPDAAASWGLKAGLPASRLTAPSYSPTQLRLAICQSHAAGSSTKAIAGSSSPSVRDLPISVESDAQMQAEGNNGPTSSVLFPASCQVDGTTVRATGTTQGASEVYTRYGDIIVVYLFTAPSSGFTQGAQLAVSSLNQTTPVGDGNWQVSATFDPSAGQPARCSVAAQPTHDEQLAS